MKHHKKLLEHKSVLYNFNIKALSGINLHSTLKIHM